MVGYFALCREGKKNKKETLKRVVNMLFSAKTEIDDPVLFRHLRLIGLRFQCEVIVFAGSLGLVSIEKSLYYVGSLKSSKII